MNCNMDDVLFHQGFRSANLHREGIMPNNRRGEKIGWTAGWIGAMVWVVVLSIVFLAQQKIREGLIGILLTAAAMWVVFLSAPWRHPVTPYWKLMLAPYGMFFLAIGWTIWSYGGVESPSMSWWNLLWLLPALGPFGLLSNKKWEKK